MQTAAAPYRSIRAFVSSTSPVGVAKFVEDERIAWQTRPGNKFVARFAGGLERIDRSVTA